jgi:hypothetical protein
VRFLFMLGLLGGNTPRSSVTLKKLHGSLMIARLFQAGKGTQVATFSGFRILLPRVEAIFTRLKFTNH